MWRPKSSPFPWGSMPIGNGIGGMSRELGCALQFLYQLSDDFNVTLDLERPGILMFRRFNHWHGSPWHFVVDGRDNLVEETNTADPLHPAQDSTFLPLASFPSPLNLTWATTNGADLMGTPIPFERSFQMAYTRTHYGTGYYIYVQFVPGTPMSHPIESWSESAAANPDQHDSGQYEDVLDLISKSGSDIAPTTGTHQASGKNALQFGSQQVLVRGHFWWGKEGSMVYDSGYKAILRLEYSPTCNAKYPGLSILRLSRGRNLATITGRLRIDPGGRVTLVADDIQFSDK